MAISKWLSLVACIVLAISIGLSITSVVLLSHSLSNTSYLKESLDSSLSDVNQRFDALEQELIGSESTPTIQDIPSTNGEYLIQAKGDKICVFTADGDLIYTRKLPIHMLPERDRELLESGIRVSSWDELVQMLQDYSA